MIEIIKDTFQTELFRETFFSVLIDEKEIEIKEFRGCDGLSYIIHEHDIDFMCDAGYECNSTTIMDKNLNDLLFDLVNEELILNNLD